MGLFYGLLPPGRFPHGGLCRGGLSRGRLFHRTPFRIPQDLQKAVLVLGRTVNAYPSLADG